MNQPVSLWAVELNITQEATQQGFGSEEYWVIHSEEDSDGYDHLFVFNTREEAEEEAKGRDHESRVVEYRRVTS